MVKRKMAVLLVFVMVLMCGITANADGGVIGIGGDGEIYFAAKDYGECSGNVTTDENYAYIPAGGSISFTINAEKAGNYRVSLLGNNTDADADVTVSIGESTYTANKSTAIGKKHMGVHAVAAGESKLTVSAGASQLKIEWIYFAPADHTVSAEGVKRVSITDFYATNVNTAVFMDQQWYYSAPDGGSIGALYFSGNGFWADFNLNAEKSGNYEIVLSAEALDNRNEFKIYDENEAIISEGTTDAENKTVTFKNVELRSGMQRIRICLAWGAYHSSTDYNMPGLYSFNITRTGDVGAINISEVSETQFSSSKYTEAVGEITTDGTHKIIPAGGAAVYNVNIPKDGNYRISFLGYGKGANSTVTAAVGGSTATTTALTDSGKKHLGVHALSSGAQNLTISAADAPLSLEYVYIKCVDHALPTSGVKQIIATDFCATNTSVPYLVDQQWYYAAPDGASVGAVTYGGNGIYADYSLNAAAAGNYDINICAATGEGTEFDITDENGAVLSNGTTDAANNVIRFSNVSIRNGMNTIRLIRKNGDGYSFIYSLYAERKGNMVQSLSPTEESLLVLANYSESTGEAAFADGVIKMTADSSVTYGISAEKAGTYKVIMTGLSAPITVTVNGDTANAKTPAAGGYRTVGRFELAAGENTVTISAAEAADFSAVKIKSVVRTLAQEGTTLVEAEDYASISEDFNQSAFVDNQWYYTYENNIGCIAYPGNGASASYKLDSQKEGLYDIVMYADKTAIGKNNKIILRDAAENIIAEQGVDVDTGKFVFKNISLKEGVNELTFCAMGLYTSAEEWNYLLSYFMEITAAKNVLSGEEYYAAQTYDSATEGVAAAADYITIPAEGTVTYNVNAKAGTYKLLLAASGANGYSKVTIGGESFETDYFDESKTYRTAGRFTLAEGENVVTVKVCGDAAQLYGLYFKNITAEISGSQASKIEAEDYLSVSNIDETMNVDGYKDSAALDNTGAIAYSKNGASASYSVKAAAAGTYDVTLYATGFEKNNSITLTVNGSTIAGSVSAADNKCVFADVPLAMGENTITLKADGLVTSISEYNMVYAYYMETVPKNVETIPVYEIYNGTKRIDRLESGSITAKAIPGSKFEGKKVFFAFAIYKDGRLEAIKTETVLSAAADTVFEKTIDNIDVTNGVYTAKIFAWSNMDGDCRAFEE